MHQFAHAKSELFWARKFHQLPFHLCVMATTGKIVNRKDKYDDASCANQWRWEWVTVVHEVQFKGEVFKEMRWHSVSQSGFARGSSMLRL